MGKQFWAGVILLALLLCLALGIGWGVYAMHSQGQTLLRQAAYAAIGGDLPKGAALLAQAKQRWERFWKLTAATANHSPMEEIDAAFAELEVLAAGEEVSQFASGCARLSELMEGMYEAHVFAWWHFL